MEVNAQPKGLAQDGAEYPADSVLCPKDGPGAADHPHQLGRGLCLAKGGAQKNDDSTSGTAPALPTGTRESGVFELYYLNWLPACGVVSFWG